MSRKSKKDDQIFIDEKKGQLYVGDKDLRLLMLRPIDIIEFTDFAGTDSNDIIMWVGKNIAKYIYEKLFLGQDFKEESLYGKKMIIKDVLETLEHLGYGRLSSMFKKDSIDIIVEDPISAEEKDNIMAKNICILYEGIFSGLLESLAIDATSEETKCYLLGDEACVFTYELLTDEFEEKDIDEAGSKVSGFLDTL